MRSLDTEIHGSILHVWPDGVGFFDVVGARYRVPWLKIFRRTVWLTNLTGTLEWSRPTDLLRSGLRWLMEEAVAMGVAHKVDAIQVSPQNGVRMYLEGVMTFSHLRTADVHDDYIDITGVRLGGYRFTIRVVNTDRPWTLLDYAGNKIELPEQ